MLWSSSKINGYAVEASDGRLGCVSDLLIDDSTWRVRWLVVDTGKWLSGRKVLLPSSVLTNIDSDRHEFFVKMTVQQIKDSPEIDTHRPVSRQMETNIYDYYGWSPYWGNGLFTGPDGFIGGPRTQSLPLESEQRNEESVETDRSDDDPNLRSIAEISEYHIHATDGEIGHVEDFLVEDDDWSIRYFVVDTKNWWPGKKVLISPRSARDIDWMMKLINLNVDRQTVKDSPAYDVSSPVDWSYERRFLNYYGFDVPQPSDHESPPLGE